MFLDNLDSIRDLDLIEEITDSSNFKLVKHRLKLLFWNKNENKNLELLNEGYSTYLREYYNILHVYSPYNTQEFEDKIDYLTLIFASNSKYHSIYIKKLAEEYSIKIPLEEGESKVNVWDFIDIAANSRNNDLHLERMILEGNNVLLNEKRQKIFNFEKIRLKIKNYVEKVRNAEMPKEIKEMLLKKSEEIFLDINVDFNVESGIKLKTKEFSGNIPENWHPPCMQEILNDVLSGGSPSHYARRSFVVYRFVSQFDPNLRPILDGTLVNKNALDIATESEIEGFLNNIVNIFKSIGDFDVEKTKYYISHNIGYRVTNHITHSEYCKNWRDDGGKGLGYYCRPDSICMRKDVIHPLDYLCHNINKNLKKTD
ncbi:DNA primase, large subunit [Methanococcus vannielii SB]|uniref:DNA primase large subunit PriL n=1 Tax=Methanococcus vannielii (strain ATCC 35089 / DSM 1224 / JCM 13029 / OCM 148 / SB) TaxID=406327 RepID=A6URI7_METVS|nr:hypothetical protein [Methanococcus vannielii]ABR55109.1 DNA primase, large subunit [Methanococcus vannielii SB]